MIRLCPVIHNLSLQSRQMDRKKIEVRKPLLPLFCPFFQIFFSEMRSAQIRNMLSTQSRIENEKSWYFSRKSS